MKFRRKRLFPIVSVAGLLVALVGSFFIPQTASAADGNKVVFAYQQATVSQDVDVSSVISGGSSLVATVSAAEVQDWKTSDDQLVVGIQLLGAGGGSIYSHNTGTVSLTSGTYSDYGVTVTAAGVGSGWNSVVTARIYIIGQDGEFWAGNYGTAVESASLKLDGVELLSNTEFTSNSGWTSSIGWQTCSGNSGGLPCIGLSGTEINNPTTTTTSTTTTTTTTPPLPVDGSACADSFVESDFAFGGVATNTTGTVQLTPASGSQFGAIWNRERLDTTKDICIRGELYLGSNNGGADGLALVLQPNSVAAGSTGGGLGYAGITPSFAIEFDTWQNSGDIYNDHAALMLNGNTTNHATWANPIDLGNIEDAQWRLFKFYWDSTENDVTVLYDKNADGDVLDSGERIFDEVSIDLPSIFSSSSGIAYWGFTAATGGANNVQSVRNISYDVAERVNGSPTVQTAPSNLTVQASSSNTATFVLADDSTTSSQWVLSATSSDTSVVANADLSASMTSSTAGQVIVSPAAQRTPGTATITVVARDADGSSVSTSFIVTVTAAPNALTVTSLNDTTSNGTLRWAITQANAGSGGMYDSIVFQSGLTGTITLGSALPNISDSVTITGPGINDLTIDGNAKQIFTINAGKSLTITDVWLRNGIGSNGGIIRNNGGTVSASRVKFSNMTNGSAVFNNNATSVATYTDCEWTNLYIGIAGDYGSTPQLPTTTPATTSWENYADTGFQNRTYVINGTFSNNTLGIYNFRFTKVTNSTFTSNSYGAHITGLNRSQILNSTFTNNTYGIYHGSWIPTTFNMGTDNRLISGNTFTGNTTAIYLDDSYNNGQRYQGWATISNNTWTSGTNWVYYGLWNGTTNVYSLALPGDSVTAFTQSSNSVPTTTTTTTSTTTTTTTTTTTVAPQPEPVVVIPNTTVAEVTETTTTPTTISEESPDTGTSVPETETTVNTQPVTTDPDNQTQQPEDQNPPPDEQTTSTEQLSPEPEPQTGGTEETTSSNDTESVLLDDVNTVIATVLDGKTVDELTDDDKEKIVAAVAAVIEAGISADAATELATSPAVLASINTSQAEAVFSEIPTETLTTEEANAIVEAVQDAPNAIREVFEDAVDLFQGAFDGYQMLNQTITVGQRRTVVAVTALTTAVAATQAAGAMGAMPTGGSRGGSASSGTNDAARKEEEEEPSGEIASDGVEWIHNIKVFRYVGGVRVLDKKAFSKKLLYGVMNLGFTLAGSLVVYLTLSGPVQVIAGISTVAAFGAAMWLHMKEPE